MQRAFVRCILIAAIPVLFGCGSSNKNSVSGKVYMGEAIVKGGTVNFVMADGSGASGSSEIAEDGSYTVRNLPVGDYKISVETASFKPTGMSAAHPYAPPDSAPDRIKEQYKKNNPEEKMKRFVAIPEVYADVKTSNLSFTIASGKNSYDIKLTEKKK